MGKTTVFLVLFKTPQFDKNRVFSQFLVLRVDRVELGQFPDFSRSDIRVFMLFSR